MDSELGRLYSDLKHAQDMLKLCKAEMDAACVFILYTEAAYPGDENQIELLIKWIEACQRRRAAEHDR